MGGRYTRPTITGPNGIRPPTAATKRPEVSQDSPAGIDATGARGPCVLPILRMFAGRIASDRRRRFASIPGTPRGLIGPLPGHGLAPSQSAPALLAHRGPATVRPVQTTRDRHRPHFGPRLADFPQFPWRNRNYSSPVLPIEGTIVPGRRSGKTRRAVGYLGSPLVTLAAMELVVDLQPRANPAHEPLGGSEKMNGFTLAIDHVLAVRLETGPPENPLELFPWKRPRLGDLVMAGSPCS